MESRRYRFAVPDRFRLERIPARRLHVVLPFMVIKGMDCTITKENGAASRPQVQASQGQSHHRLSAYAKEVTMEVTVQVPESSFSALRTSPEKFAREMKLAVVEHLKVEGRAFGLRRNELARFDTH